MCDTVVFSPRCLKKDFLSCRYHIYFRHHLVDQNYNKMKITTFILKMQCPAHAAPGRPLLCKPSLTCPPQDKLLLETYFQTRAICESNSLLLFLISTLFFFCFLFCRYESGSYIYILFVDAYQHIRTRIIYACIHIRNVPKR